MAETDDSTPGGTTSDGTPWVFNPFRYVDGSDIRWRRLLTTVVGAGIFAWFQGLASVILNFADVPIALLNGLAEFLAQVVFILTEIPAVAVDVGFAAAVPFVVRAGLAGFVAALVIVLPTVFILTEVIRRVGE